MPLLTAAHRAGTLFVVYLIAGICYNYFILGLRGVELIPRYSIFSVRGTLQWFRDLFNRIKERSGSLHLGSGGMGSWGSRGQSGYNGLAASRDEEAGMLSGPRGWLDEQDDEEEHDEHASRPSGMDSSGVIRL